MSRLSQFTVSGRRSRMARLTPAGWFMLVFGLSLGLLLLFGGGRWLLAQWPVWFPPEAPVVAVETPVATVAPTPESTPVAEVPFPAYWAAGMYQDAAGNWWPAEDVREQVQEMVEKQFRECDLIMAKDEIDLYTTVATTDFRKCYSGELLEGRLWGWKNYLDNGSFNSLTEIVEKDLLVVQAFSPDGLTAQIAQTYMQAYLLQYNSDTKKWVRIDIPSDGLFNGVQYLGVGITEVKYDTEDGRWKMQRFVQWIPRP